MACGWPMYRIPYNGSFRYRCALYSQSCGDQCHHNHIDGVIAARFALSCVRQHLLAPSVLPKLEKRLRELAERDDQPDPNVALLGKRKGHLAELQDQKELATANMSRATTDAQFKALSQRFDEIEEQIAATEREIQALTKETTPSENSSDEVEKILEAIHDLSELAGQADSLELARQLFHLTNLRMFMRFRPTKPKKTRYK